MRRVTLALAIAGALVVTLAAGCTTAARPGTAAVADGTSYSVSEVDDIARQLAPLTQDNSRLAAAGQVIPLLVIGDDVRRVTRELGGSVLSEQDVRDQLGPQLEQSGISVSDFDTAALEVLGTVVMAGALRGTPEGDQAMTELLNGLDIEVNPRYGTATTTGTGQFVIGPPDNPWLATASPSDPAGAPGDPAAVPSAEPSAPASR